MFKNTAKKGFGFKIALLSCGLGVFDFGDGDNKCRIFEINAVAIMKILVRFSSFFVLLLTFGMARAQNTSSSGTDFWLGFMPNGVPGTTEVREELFIASSTTTTVTIDVGGTPNTFYLSAGQVADENVSGIMTSVPETPTTNAIHITSSNPITVYGYSVWTAGGLGGSPDGYLGLPTEAYGTKYYTVNFPDNNVFGQCPGEFLIISPEDSNQVTITPTAPTRTGRPAGVPWTVLLAKGQTYLVQSPGTNSGANDLTGSLITSSKPIALLTGHQITSVPSAGASSADHLIEMDPSVDKWGTQYFDMPMADHPIAGDYIRILSAQDGNTITFTGGGSITLNAGEYKDLTQQTKPMVFTSTNGKPFIVAQYSYSQGFDNDPGPSDPWMLLFTPKEQFERSMIFRTPTPARDTFTNYVTFVSLTSAISQITVNGQPVGSYAVAGQAAFPNTNPSMSAITIVLPNTTRNFTASGPEPFGAYQYGFSNYEGYGWPAGMSQRNIACSVTLSDVGPLEFCEGEERTIYATPLGQRYGWERDGSPLGDTTDSLMITSSGTYMAIVTSAKGCVDSAAIQAVVDPLPQPQITPNDSQIQLCHGTSQTLTASGGGTYLWNTGDTTASIPISSGGTYAVVVTNANGCSAASHPVMVTVLPQPDYTASSLGDTAICADSGVLYVRSIHLHNNLDVSQRLMAHAVGNGFFGISQSLVIAPDADTIITDSLITDGRAQLYSSHCYFEDSCGLLADSVQLLLDALNSNQPITLDLPANGVSALAGDTLSVPLHLSWIWSCLSRMHFSLDYEADLLRHVALRSSAIELDSTVDSGGSVREFYSLKPNPDTGTLGDILFQSYLSLQDSTPLTLSILDYGDSCLPCVTSAAQTPSDIRIIFGCGDRTIQRFMAKRMILIGQIRPDPASNEFTVDFHKPPTLPVRYEIYDALGRMLLSGETGQNALTISTRELPNGMLLLRATMDGFDQYRSFMIVK